MEKRRPTYDLAAVKRVLGSVATLRMSATATADAADLGFDDADVASVVATLQPGMFYKSMTTFRNHRLWQDVYHVPADGWMLYVKVQADEVAEFRLMSFKEL